MELGRPSLGDTHKWVTNSGHKAEAEILGAGQGVGEGRSTFDLQDNKT
jgi:hypothetical protein